MKGKRLSVINLDPEILGGMPVFETRVQSKIFLIIWKLVIQLSFHRWISFRKRSKLISVLAIAEKLLQEISRMKVLLDECLPRNEVWIIGSRHIVLRFCDVKIAYGKKTQSPFLLREIEKICLWKSWHRRTSIKIVLVSESIATNSYFNFLGKHRREGLSFDLISWRSFLQ